jgi:iron complex transport system substrate-binding protein
MTLLRRCAWRAVLVAVCLVQAACMRVVPTPKAGLPVVALDQAPTHNLLAQCVDGHRTGIDLFPQKLTFRHSEQLQVRYGPHYKEVSFTPRVDTGETLRFLLVQCGAPVPPHDRHTVVVQVPIQRLATANRAIMGALDDLGIIDILVGVDEPRAITVPSLQRRVEQGLVLQAGGGTHGSMETIMALQPDVYLTFYSAYPSYNMHPKLWELGVRALPQADHLEGTPLARAEWLKLLALLTNTEARANEVFDGIEQRYQQLAARTAALTERTPVLSGQPEGRGEFELFGGRNQRSRLIADAGGRYVLEQHPYAGSWLIVPFEELYAQGAQAPVWLGGTAGHARVGDLVASHALSGWFRATREGRVFAFDQGYRGAWAFPYADQGMTRPDRLLAEAMQVLHPLLLTAEELRTPTTFTRALENSPR